MTKSRLDTASTILLLCCWRSLTDWDLRRRLQELQVEARRCFRIARSTANLNLASELDAIGCDFEKEAAGLAAGCSPQRTRSIIPASRIGRSRNLYCSRDR